MLHRTLGRRRRHAGAGDGRTAAQVAAPLIGAAPPTSGGASYLWWTLSPLALLQVPLIKQPFDPDESYLDDGVGYALAAVGFWKRGRQT